MQRRFHLQNSQTKLSQQLLRRKSTTPLLPLLRTRCHKSMRQKKLRLSRYGQEQSNICHAHHMSVHAAMIGAEATGRLSRLLSVSCDG